MPLQPPFEPVFALATVPLEQAGAVVGILATAVAAQWKAYRNDDLRSRDELRNALETVHDTTTTYTQLLAVTNRLVEVSGKAGEEDRLFYDRVIRELEALGKTQTRMVDAMEKRFRETG